MLRTLHTFTAVMFSSAVIAVPALADMQDSGESFLKKAAQGQQAEIVLGHMATQRAANPDVKKFGAKMMLDHQKASEEVQQLAAKEGVELPEQMSEQQKEKQQQLSKLSGKEFDLAYIQYMLKDHKKEVKLFEQSAQQLQNTEVKQWASSALPILKQHLDQANNVAMSLGPRNLFSEESMGSMTK